jgi:sugar-specific transcriptional regulator TrmB
MTKYDILSNMAKNRLKSQLIELDFSENDASVYSKLLELGPTTAGPLISKTQLHRNIIYTSLDHLVARKLVTEKQVRGKKFFAAASPNILIEEFREKAEAAKDVAKFIEKQLPKGVEDITIHQGNEEYLDLLSGIIRQMPKGSTKYVLGTGGEAFMAHTMRPIWKPYHKVAHEQGIKIRMLGYEPQRGAIEPDTAPEKIYEMRYLPAEIENPSGIHIYPEAKTVLNIIYSTDSSPVTAIKIKNPALVQGYLNLFNNLWKTAKK